ncbi:alpha/beta fold hydrolase [Conyzicola nivalis]|uniref:Lipase n=1 Tax=Conyzicola nivalis TaxID=1477021 RepID=A0A916WJ26_9MICO|nr:alpha/beta hydrolase [Conyzicola nivalis]GGB05991.1 lipase [Conyzicola nivalis]
MTSRTSIPSQLAEGSHVAEIDGNRIHYEVRGSGPVLIAPTPGWGPSLGYMMPLPALERHCTVVYFDTRHSGESTGPERADAYTLGHFVSDIEGLRQHLGSPMVFLAGHSAGGHQVLAYGIAHSANLLGIICIDGIAAQDELRAREMLKMMESRRSHPFFQARPGFVDTAVQMMTGSDTTARTTDELFAALGPFYFHDPALAAGVFAAMQIDEAVQGYSRAAGFQRDNLLDGLHRIAVPTLIIVGDDDFICDPVSQGARIHERVRDSTLAVIHACGHVPWIEQPSEFDRVCDEWLAVMAPR